MSTAVIDELEAGSVAELLRQLGDVPAWRVRLHPSPGQATERDVLDIHARTKRLCELIDGVLVEKVMGYRESFLAIRIARLLDVFVELHRLGIVTGADGMMRLTSRNVRIPDVSFVSWNQLPKRQVPSKPIPNLFPDLAVEVLSESNTPREMELKRIDYFGAGTRLVWQVDPQSRQVEIFTSVEQRQVLDSTQVLDGGDVLPGFTLSLADLFAALDEQPSLENQ